MLGYIRRQREAEERRRYLRKLQDCERELEGERWQAVGTSEEDAVDLWERRGAWSVLSREGALHLFERALRAVESARCVERAAAGRAPFLHRLSLARWAFRDVLGDREREVRRAVKVVEGDPTRRDVALSARLRSLCEAALAAGEPPPTGVPYR